MAGAYSQDLRDRVINAVVVEGMSRRAAAARFGVLCDRLLSERGVKADTSLMSRFLRRLGVTLKKRRSSRASRTART
jgi:transposase